MIPTYGKVDSKEVKFSGRRIRTKFYQTGNGLLIHADVNGSLNILRKVVPTAFSLGIEEPLRWAGFPTCSKWRGVVVRESRGYSRQTKAMRYLSMFFGTI
ncbi:hypothetical protein WJM97_18595 [Okeanomitos corallinicola TIOX110]|uniref:Transposase n=1 Tax=Okeanomitos corallinicola TIOX110 TaxID=3133117 RepID=A0ABZ2UPS6_9CYAN